jgi:acyl-lipid omega-6 desaturase (Delta-12 desaturase)
LLVQLPITLLAGSIGVWLFYVQHQFEDTFWAHDEGWNFHEAALHGSSHYDLPSVLRWFTANIGVHHVHHLCSRIPYYRLPGVSHGSKSSICPRDRYHTRSAEKPGLSSGAPVLTM